jgi:hypothetical protein
VLHLQLIILLVGYDVSINNDGLLVTDFINLKIKLTQSFRYVYKSMMYVCMFIGVNGHTFMRICVYIVSKKQDVYILWEVCPVLVTFTRVIPRN